MRDFALVQDSLQGLQDLAGVDCLSYLKPFLDTIVSERASGPITGTALASVNKFLLYGFLRPDVPRAREAIVAVAAAATRCKFESSSVREDETTLMQILEVLRNCIRCPAGTLLTDESVWDMCGSAYRISRFEDASHLLHRSAESTLAHLVLTIFSRVPEIADEVEDRLEAAGEGGSDPGAGGASGSAASAPEGGDQGRSLVPAAPAPHPAKGDAGTWKAIELGAGPDRLAPYGEKALVKLLSWLSSLTEPATQPAHTRVLGLRLVNMVLESAGADMGRLPSLVRVATAELCRNLVQNSRTTEPAVLALTFRVVYSLFASLTQHLKVPLEVFFVSVHLSLVDSRDAPPENRELALEALLEFARDGELMADIFVNYDCSVRSTNLFEIFTGTLARNAVPSSGERLNSLHVLALEGVLAVLESLARRCELAARAGVAGALDTTTGDGPDAVPDDSPMAAAASWADSSDPRVEALRRRRQLKRRFALAAARFNACDGKHDEGDAGWLRYATQLGVLPVPEVADGGLAMEGAAAAADGAACGADDQEEELPGEEGPVTALDGALRPGDVARFLRTCPGLDRGHIGEYIAARADPRKPRTLFQSAVRGAFVRSFDFRGLNIVTALRAFLEAFRLPGESQMIERLMEDFSGRLFAQSPWPYSDQDAIFVFAYSIIMLTTDQHNDQVMRKMTLDDFVRNNRGINGGQDLPAELLAEVYADVQRRPLALHSDATEVAARPAAAGAADGHAPASGRAAGGSGASDAGGTSADGTGAGGAANGASTGAEAEEAAKAREKRLAALGDHWDGVLRRQLRVSEFATGQAPAGAHEGEMLAVIGNGALAAIASACESTQSEETLRHALEGIRHLALASALRGQQTLLDRAISAAAGFARRSVREAAALDAWVVRAPSAVPATMVRPRTVPSGRARSPNRILRASSRSRSAGRVSRASSSFSEPAGERGGQPLLGGDAPLRHARSTAPGPARPGSSETRAAAVEAAAAAGGLPQSAGATQGLAPPGVAPAAGALAQRPVSDPETGLPWAPPPTAPGAFVLRRAVLAVRALCQLLATHRASVREAWPDVIAAMGDLQAADSLPADMFSPILARPSAVASGDSLGSPAGRAGRAAGHDSSPLNRAAAGVPPGARAGGPDAAPRASALSQPAEAVPGAGGTEVAAAASRGGGALLSAADVGFEDIEAPDGRRLPSERFEGTRAADGRVTKAAKRIRRPIEQLATAVMAQQRRRSRGASMESIHSSGLGVHGAAASPARGAGGKVGADPDARAAAAARRAAASLSVALAWVGGASPASVAATAMATRDRRFAAAWVRFARQVASERVGPRRRAMLCGPAADGWSMASEVRPWDSAEQRALMALAGLRALAPRAAEAAASCLATELGARPAGEDNGAVEWPQGEAGEDAAALVSALLERAEAVAAAAVLHGDDEDSVADERTDELLASLRSHAWTKDAGSASSSALAGVGDRSSGAHGLAGGEWTDLSDDDSDEQDGGEHARPRQGAAASRAAAEVASGAGASPVGSGAEGESDGDDSDGTRKAGPRSGLFSMLFGADAPAPAQAGHRSSNAAVAASIAAECARAAHALGRVVVPGSAEAAALGDGPLGDTLPDGALEALVAAASRSALAGLASAISPARSREERSGSAAPTSSGAQATLSSAVLCVEVLGQASLRPGGACRPEIWRRPLLDVLAEAADCIERIGPSRRRREGTAAALGDVASHTTEGDVVAAEATEPSDGGGDVAAGASSLGPPAAWWPGDGLHEAAMSSETRGRRRETPSAPAARPPSLRDGRVRTTRPVASEAGFLLERAATLVLLAATRMTARADPAVPAARKRNARILARWCAAASGPDGHAQADAADASGPEQAVELVRVVVVPMLAAIAALPDTAMDVVAPRTAVGVGMLMQAGAGYVTDAGFWTLAWDVLCRCRSRFFAAPAAWHAASLAAEALEACGPHSAARAVRFFAPALTTAAPETFVAASAAWLGIAADQRLARRPEHGSSEAASLIAAFSKAGGARGLPFYADVAARAMGHPVFELRRRVGWEACRIITRLLAGLPAASADGAGDWRAAWALVLQAATWSTQEAANSAAAWFARQDDPASAAGQEELASESKLAWAMAHEALTLVKAVAEAASAMAEGMRSGDQAAEASPCAPLAHLIKSVLTSSSPGEAPAHWWIAILPGGSDLAAESVSVCCRAVLTTMRERPTDPRARDLWKALVSALAADAAEAAEEAPPGAENSVHAPDAVQEATLQGLKNVLMVAAADRLLGGGGADEAGLWDETWECLKAASAGLEASMRAELQPLFAPEAVAPASDRDGDDAGDASDTSQPDEEAATSEGPPSEVVRAGELPPVPASTGSGSPMPAQSASAEHAAPSSAAQGPLSAEPLAEDGASTPRPATPDSKGDDDATLAAMTDAGSPTAAPEQEADDDDADVDAGSGDDEEGAEGDGCAVM